MGTEIKFLVSLTVEPEASETNVLGKLVSELQTDVNIEDNYITGTLNYVEGYTGFSGDPELQEGNFLALKFEATEGATTTVEILNGYSGPVELDSDMNWVGRIADNETQKIKVVSTLDGDSISKTFDLSLLECLSE
ncbi:MAG: hypothetical protein IJJ10_03265 [Bacillus sp. (in: Bacteria)]|nr:hypothetical protein [Bacillus sp. (in: firmicutes)]